LTASGWRLSTRAAGVSSGRCIGRARNHRRCVRLYRGAKACGRQAVDLRHGQPSVKGRVTGAARACFCARRAMTGGGTCRERTQRPDDSDAATGAVCCHPCYDRPSVVRAVSGRDHVQPPNADRVATASCLSLNDRRVTRAPCRMPVRATTGDPPDAPSSRTARPGSRAGGHRSGQISRIAALAGYHYTSTAGNRGFQGERAA